MTLEYRGYKITKQCSIWCVLNKKFATKEDAKKHIDNLIYNQFLAQ
jgi:uncharacterized lipoprotein YehR (DUF1307 family)